MTPEERLERAKEKLATARSNFRVACSFVTLDPNSKTDLDDMTKWLRSMQRAKRAIDAAEGARAAGGAR